MISIDGSKANSEDSVIKADSALGREVKTGIANSAKFQNEGIGNDLSDTNSLATEVSRDFIPPCPVRISPAQAAALGPATRPDAEP